MNSIFNLHRQLSFMQPFPLPLPCPSSSGRLLSDPPTLWILGFEITSAKFPAAFFSQRNPPSSQTNPSQTDLPICSHFAVGDCSNQLQPQFNHNYRYHSNLPPHFSNMPTRMWFSLKWPSMADAVDGFIDLIVGKGKSLIQPYLSKSSLTPHIGLADRRDMDRYKRNLASATMHNKAVKEIFNEALPEVDSLRSQ